MKHPTIHHGDNYPADNIQLGEVSQRVCAVQDFLGLPQGPWDWACVSALVKYQQFAELVANGVADEKTLSAITLSGKC